MQFQPNETYIKWADTIEKLSAIKAGPTALRNRTYLPQMEREENDSYAKRSRHTILTNFTEKTVSAASGMVFRKPLSYENLKLDDNDVDGEGQTLNRFANDVLTSGLWFGHSCIIVDAPKRDGIRTLADERAAGLQPFFVLAERKNIIDWEYEYVNGKAILQRIVIEEKPEGEAKRQVRVMYIGGGEIWRQFGDEGELVIDDEWTNDLGYIPIATFYTRREAPLESKPMFDNVADLNIRHFNLDSKIWMMTEYMVPMLKMWGQTNEQEETGGGQTMAVNRALQWGDKESGDAEWMVYEGKEIETIERLMASAEQRMALMGLSMLSSKDESKELTATEKTIDSAQETSDLASIASNLQGTLNEAYQMWCDMAGLSAGEEEISVNTEFVAELLSVEEMRELREQYNSGLLDKETFWMLMERGGRFKGVDLDMLKARVEAEEPGFAAG
jgi:hypothetical protein